MARVTGVGDTDYAADHTSTVGEPDHADVLTLAARAVRSALHDAGLERADIDGVVVGEGLRYSRTVEVLGLTPQWGFGADVANAIPAAIAALTSRHASRILLVHGSSQRSSSVRYGGPNAAGRERHMSYGYYAPYGFTSQGGINALMATRMLAAGWMTVEELWHVVDGQREFASRNAKAIRPERISLEEYLEDQYIAEPLRRADYCLVNDGAVALVLERQDGRQVEDPRPGAVVSGLARADALAAASTFDSRLRELFEPQLRTVGRAIADDSGVALEAVACAQLYDAFSVHVPVLLQGLGLRPGTRVGELLGAGETRHGGALPTNTAGGHLAESYMQGWGHQVEAVRQIRGEAANAVTDAEHVLYASVGASICSAILYSRA